ncbi:MAG: hypothetical protein ACI4V7_03675 [Succinivibrionaceae bacterium]
MIKSLAIQDFLFGFMYRSDYWGSFILREDITTKSTGRLYASSDKLRIFTAISMYYIII